jgi:hypothetical protein
MTLGDPTVRNLPIARIKIEDDFQVRTMTIAQVAKDYAEAMNEGAVFPPLKVVHDTARDIYYLCDGRHRREALMKNGIATAECEVYEGTRSDALLLACTSNATNGLQMTHPDRRRAVQMLLCDPTYSDPDSWSDRKIGKLIGIHHHTVGEIREQMYPQIGVERSAKRDERRERLGNRPSAEEQILSYKSAPSSLPPPVAPAQPSYQRSSYSNGSTPRNGSTGSRPVARQAVLAALDEPAPTTDYRSADEDLRGWATELRMRGYSLAIIFMADGDAERLEPHELEKLSPVVLRILAGAIAEAREKQGQLTS